MKTLNGQQLTKARAESYVKAYINAECDSVQNFYKHCSTAKRYAEGKILGEMVDLNGKLESLKCQNYKVLSGNCMTFTAGYGIYDSVSGNLVMVIIHTHKNRYVLSAIRTDELTK